MQLRPDRLQERRWSALARHQTYLETATKAQDKAAIARIAATIARTEANLKGNVPHGGKPKAQEVGGV